MMSSKQQDPAPFISPVLFLTVEGEPMSFFLRPGSLKRKLQPLITAGGGLLCKVQEPGAILLMDPEERSSIPESAAHLYVSTQYIHDCIEKEEQLNLEDYKLNPDVVKRSSPRLSSSRGSPAGLSGGRTAYSPEEDAAILKFISKHQAKIGGILLWKEMESLRVTSHTWQSMKSRYKDHLAKKQPTSIEVETQSDANKLPEKQTEAKLSPDSDGETSCGEATAGRASPHSTESDLTQIDVQSVPAAMAPEQVVTQMAASVPEEERPTTKDELNINTHSESVEGETSHCFQTEEQTGNQSNTGTPEPERDGPPTALPQNHNLPKSPPPAELKLSTKTNSPKRPKDKPDVSWVEEQPQRRLTRRQLELGASPPSPEPYGKKLRSASRTAELSTATPLALKKDTSAAKSATQKAEMTEEPPQKKTRGKKVSAEAEGQVEQDSHDTETKTAQTDDASWTPQKAAKKKEKRQLGILEMATREFEDDSESDEDEAPDPSNAETTASPADVPQPMDTSADSPGAQSSTEPGPRPQGIVPEIQDSSSICVENTDHPNAGPVSGAIDAPSEAHLFIFDSESQQDDSQSVVGDDSAAPNNPQPSEDDDAAFCLTQVQLEEDKQRIRELMNQTNKDLVCVTKALLKTSGDFKAAVDLLLNPSSVSAPFWNRHDDSLLRSSDPIVHQKLKEHYGEESVAKRIVFLEVE